MSKSVTTTPTTELALPSQFRETALAFPEHAKTVIATIEVPTEAAEGVAKSQALARLARDLKATTEEVNHIEYGKLLFAAKVEELCPSEQGKRTDKTSHAAGGKLFHYNTLADYRKLYKHQKASGKIDDYFAVIAEHGHEQEASLAGFLRFVNNVQLTGNTAWYTPREYVVASRKVMGSIELDPASCQLANETVRAERYFSAEDDGLAQHWSGNIFMNPPYSFPLVEQFVDKLCSGYAAGDVSQAVLLTNAAVDTAWWQRAAESASVVCCVSGRIRFYGESGVGQAPRFPQTFVYLGDRAENFITSFSEFGLCLLAGDLRRGDKQEEATA